MTTIFILILFAGICVEVAELSENTPLRKNLLKRLRELNKKEINEEERIELRNLASKGCMLSAADLSCLVLIAYLLSQQFCLIPVLTVALLSIFNITQRNKYETGAWETGAWFYIDKLVCVICYAWIIYAIVGVRGV